MKYISIDLETTGLDPNNNQILEFGCVLEDTNNFKPDEFGPSFRRVIAQRQDYVINRYALEMNLDLLAEIKDRQELPDEFDHNADDAVCYVEDLYQQFELWLGRNGLPEYDRLTAAGKNFTGVDLRFLAASDDRWGRTFHRRVIDPAVLFMDWKNDETLPAMPQCCVRGGIGLAGYHTAVGDAKTVINLIRTATCGYSKPVGGVSV